MKEKEQFLREYQDTMLDGPVLPPCLKLPYQILSCLKDGERQVYLVQDQAGCFAVLKVQSAGRADSLRQEYDLLRSLNHPQLPRPFFYLEWEGREYLVREYVEGISLYEKVTAQGPLISENLRDAVLSLCQVLMYLHSQSPPVICRDVKPQNVILDEAGRCHLIDLGAARCHRPEKQGDTVLLGTRLTAPPEQFGYQQTDQRSDVYSLGVLIHFLRTGRFDLHALDGSWNFWARVIRRCTAFDPDNRYPSVQAVFRRIEYRWHRLVGAVAAGVMSMVLLTGFFQGGASQTQGVCPLLAEALRQELQLEDGAPIPEERLSEVRQLLVCGQRTFPAIYEHENLAASAHDRYEGGVVHGDIGDADLKLLAQCSNLQVLVLDYQQITDLSFLAELPLEYLSLTGNQISDLEPLAGLTELKILDLGENPVRFVEVLAGLPKLQEVTLEATGISTVESFAGSGIRFLNVRGNWITDFSPLESCLQLSCLIVDELPDGAVESLSGLTSLTELRLYSTPEVDLSYFTGFHKLQNLDLYGSTISHPELLARLPELRFLNIGGTGIQDLSFLSQMPVLTDVDLRNNPITDLTPLSDCPFLRLLILSRQHRLLAEEQIASALFEIQYQ